MREQRWIFGPWVWFCTPSCAAPSPSMTKAFQIYSRKLSQVRKSVSDFVRYELTVCTVQCACIIQFLQISVDGSVFAVLCIGRSLGSIFHFLPIYSPISVSLHLLHSYCLRIHIHVVLPSHFRNHCNRLSWEPSYHMYYHLADTV